MHDVWFTTLAGLIFIKTVSMPKFSLPPWVELAYISPLQAKPYIEAACCLKKWPSKPPTTTDPPTNLKCPQKPQITWFTTTKYKNNMGSVHILHYHVEGGRGFRTRLIALMVPLGGVGRGNHQHFTENYAIIVPLQYLKMFKYIIDTSAMIILIQTINIQTTLLQVPVSMPMPIFLLCSSCVI